jgi:hypothetical protein
MKVKVNDVRPAFKKAKKEFAESWIKNNPDYLRGYSDTFWKDFAVANNMTISIDRHEAGFPEITVLEFNSEQDYVWFMLRWS